MRNLFRYRYLLLAPAIFILLLVGIYPFVKLLITSFQGITLFSTDTSFVGWIQYQRLLDDQRFWDSVLRTLGFTAIALPIQFVLGLGLAYLFLADFPLKRLLVALILLPTVISPIVAGATWRLMLDHNFGPVNHLISMVAGREVELLWTIESHLVWPSLLLAEVWQWTPFMFLFLLTALSSVDSEQLEAAEIDGASKFRKFRYIVLPAILPIATIALLIRGLDLFRLFDIVWTMTQGGPGTMTETISIYAYQMAFREFDVSYTAAFALIVILLLTFLVLGLLRLVEIER